MDGNRAVQVLQDVLLVAFVARVVYMDWRVQRIPNDSTYPTMVAGLLLGVAESVTDGFGLPGEIRRGGLLDHVAALVVAFLVSYPMVAAGWMKAGDGKFLMAVGALKGTAFLLSSTVWGVLLGGVIALLFIAGRRLAPQRDGQERAMRSLLHSWIPYGVALGLGAIVALAFELRRLS